MGGGSDPDSIQHHEALAHSMREAGTAQNIFGLQDHPRDTRLRSVHLTLAGVLQSLSTPGEIPLCFGVEIPE